MSANPLAIRVSLWKECQAETWPTGKLVPLWIGIDSDRHDFGGGSTAEYARPYSAPFFLNSPTRASYASTPFV